MNEFVNVPPEILMGEASLCGFWAMVAVAHVFQRNPQMNGWHDQPDSQSRLAAGSWWLFPDLSQGARFVFSIQDLRLREVKEIIKRSGRPRAQFQCIAGGLAFY